MHFVISYSNFSIIYSFLWRSIMAEKKKILGLFDTTQFVGLLIAIVALVVMWLIQPGNPEAGGMTRAGINTIGVLVMTIALMICRTFPVATIGILLVPIMFFMGVVPNANTGAPDAGLALAGYANTTTFFIFASFGITAALVNTPLAKRMMRWVIKTFGRTTAGVLLAIMLVAGIFSAIMSNLPVVAAFLPLANQFVILFPEGEKRTRTACAFMLGVPIAGMAGGVITPAGAAINVMVMDRLQTAAGINITFLAWMVIGVPLGLLTILFAWWFLNKVYKPAQLTQDEIDDYIGSLDVSPKWSAAEVRVVIIVCVMFVLWILSTWIKVLNTTIVAMCGLFLLICPGIGVMTIPQFFKEVNWSMFIVFGALTTLSGRLAANGVVNSIKAVVSSLNPGNVNPFIVAFVITIVAWLLLLLMPIGNSLTNQLSVPLIAICLGFAIDPVVAVVPLLYCGLCAFMIPIDTLPLMAYNYGYYSVGQQVKSTIPICLFISVITAIWVPLTCTFGLW